MNHNIHLSPFDPKKQRLAFLRVERETIIRRDLQYSRNYETLQNAIQSRNGESGLTSELA